MRFVKLIENVEFQIQQYFAGTSKNFLEDF